MADDSPDQTKGRASTRMRRGGGPADQATWRKKMQASRIKFDDIQKEVFLAALARHGKKMLAAKQAGVCLQTVNDHLENDPDFAANYDETVEDRAQRIVDQLEREALEGHTQPIFDKDGNEVGEKRIYESGLRAMLLKRYDPEYKDRQEIDLKGGGGVLLVPATATDDEWAAMIEEHNKTVVQPDPPEAA